MTIPNMTHPDAPIGGTPADNKVIRTWGEPRKFDFKPKDHVAIAEGLNIVDFEAGSAVAGQKFYFLKNDAVLLELALVQYAFDTLLEHGYTPIITPDVARVEVLEGIGFMPRGPETQIYSLANTDLCLIATAEITLGGMHRDQIMDEARAAAQVRRPVALLPHGGRGAGPGHARPLPRAPVHEGRDVRVLHAGAERGDSPGNPRHRGGDLPGTGPAVPRHRHLHRRPGRAGVSQVRSRGLDARPRRKGRIRRSHQHIELHRLPGRRLDIRYKSPKHKGTRFVHTLNGTAVAVSRCLVALLENYQQADGSVLIPRCCGRGCAARSGSRKAVKV